MLLVDGGQYRQMTVKDVWGDIDIFNPIYSMSISCDNSIRLYVIVFLTYTKQAKGHTLTCVQQ